MKKVHKFSYKAKILIVYFIFCSFFTSCLLPDPNSDSSSIGSIPGNQPCSRCMGSGRCIECDGTGGLTDGVKCKVCNGRGRCRACLGTGIYEGYKRK